MTARDHRGATATARRVLIVDADADPALPWGLARSGYTASLAPSIGEARALLAEQQFAALVTDVSVADGGRRWLAELRAVRPRLPVMVVAPPPVAALGWDRVYGLADAVLAKPTEAQVLTAMLDRVLDRRSAS